MSEFGGISLYWGITHSLVMDFEMTVIPYVHFPEVILHEFDHFASSSLWGHISLIRDWFWRCFFCSELPHFDMMYSLIFYVETWPLVYECCLRWIIEMMIFWDQSPQLTWFDVDIHLPLLHTRTFFFWHHYTYIHLILLDPTNISLWVYLFLSFYRILSYSLDRNDVGQFWVFWLSGRILLDIRFSIFHDGRAY